MKEEHKNIPYRRLDETISLDELKSFLWGAATRLRGQIDAAGYKEYIFPLLFFKRISDVYDEQFEDFVAEGGEEYAGMQAAELAIRIRASRPYVIRHGKVIASFKREATLL